MSKIHETNLTMVWFRAFHGISFNLIYGIGYSVRIQY